MPFQPNCIVQRNGQGKANQPKPHPSVHSPRFRFLSSALLPLILPKLECQAGDSSYDADGSFFTFNLRVIFFGAAPPPAPAPALEAAEAGTGCTLGDRPGDTADGFRTPGDGTPILGDAAAAVAGCDGADPGNGFLSPPDGKGFLALSPPDGRGLRGLKVPVGGTPRGAASGAGRGAGDPSTVGDEDVRFVPGSGCLAGVATMVESAAALAAFSALMAL